MARPPKRGSKTTPSVEDNQKGEALPEDVALAESFEVGENGTSENGLPVAQDLKVQGAIVAIDVAAVEIVSDQSDQMLPLSDEEKGRLFELERQVEESFYRAGIALKEIRDSRLYRITHATFEEYCRERFGFERRYPYQLIDAAIVADNIRQCVRDAHILPTNEYQLRPLAKLKGDPAKQAEVWLRAVERAQGKQPTYEAVKETVQEIVVTEKDDGVFPSLQVGNICVVRNKANDPRLASRAGFWGIVKSVDSTSATIRFYDLTVDAVSLRELDLVELSKKDQREREKTLQLLSSIYESGLKPNEKVVPPLLDYFVRNKAKSLTSFEQGLLCYIEQQERKGKSGASVDEEV